jgi:hypothetical protein
MLYHIYSSYRLFTFFNSFADNVENLQALYPAAGRPRAHPIAECEQDCVPAGAPGRGEGVCAGGRHGGGQDEAVPADVLRHQV